MQVDFVVESPDDSGLFREVTSVLLVDVDGKVVATFYTADGLAIYLAETEIEDFRVIANDMVGPPRSDLFGRVICNGERGHGPDTEP